MFKKAILFFLLPALIQGQVNTVLEEWKNDPTLKQASIGFSVLDAKTSELLAEYNSHQLLVPASTLKIVTTSAALQLLGPNYRYETKLYYTGNFNKETGILDGDLLIVGSGDPSLQSENFFKENDRITDTWAKLLKEKGLKELKGDIIGDASFFQKAVPGKWIWEDVSNYYGTASCGLSYKDNKFKVIYESKEPGSRAKVTGTYPTYLNTGYTLISEVTAKGTEDEAYAYGDPFSFAKEIRGSIPPNKTNYEIEVALPDPALLCVENLYTSLTRLGIKCKGNSARSNYQERPSLEKQLIYTHYSPALDRIIFYTNLKSNNLYSESILRTIGKGDLKAGLSAVKKFCSGMGLDSNEVFMDDGCGLARINGMTTNFQASLLSKIYQDSLTYKTISASLPIAGKQGSMAGIGKGTFIENNLRAKTGYITRVRAYCGYVRSRSGKDLAFSVIFNNYNCTARDAKLKLEKFLVALGEM